MQLGPEFMILEFLLVRSKYKKLEWFSFVNIIMVISLYQWWEHEIVEKIVFLSTNANVWLGPPWKVGSRHHYENFCKWIRYCKIDLIIILI